MGDDDDRRQRRPSRDLGLHRARRRRLRAAPRSTAATGVRRRSGTGSRPPACASGSSTSRSRGLRPEIDGLRDRGLRRRRPRGGPDLSRASSSASSASASGRSSSTTASRSATDGGVDLDLVRRAAEQKVEVALWLAERFEPGAPVRRLHGRRPRPPPLLAGLGAARRDSARRRGLPDPRRRGRAHSPTRRPGRGRPRRLRPRRRAARRRREPQRLARRAGVPRAIGGGGCARSDGTSCASRLFELRRHLPEGLRYAGQAAAARLRERAYEATRRTRSSTGPARGRSRTGRSATSSSTSAGREREGIVDPGRLRACSRRDRAAALELREPDGEPIVAAVHRREDLFHGPELEKLPDLIVEFDDYAWLGKGNLRSSGTTRSGTGSRSSPGAGTRTSAATGTTASWRSPGPRRQRRARTIAAGIEDVAPTVLYLLGQPLPTDLEGRLLDEALDPSAARRAAARVRRTSRRASSRRPSVYARDEVARGRGAAPQPRLPRVASPRAGLRRRRRLAELGDEPPSAPSSTCQRCSPSRVVATASASREPDPRRRVTRPASREPAAERAPGGRRRPRRSGASRGTTTGPLPVRERGHDRADAGVRDDDACARASRATSSSKGRKSTHGRVARPHGRRAVLDDELLVARRASSTRSSSRSNGASFVPTVTKITRMLEEDVADVARARGHRARRARATARRSRSATGAISRQLSDGPSIRVKLST